MEVPDLRSVELAINQLGGHAMENERTKLESTVGIGIPREVDCGALKSTVLNLPYQHLISFVNCTVDGEPFTPPIPHISCNPPSTIP